jgi:hypothetical protein
MEQIIGFAESVQSEDEDEPAFCGTTAPLVREKKPGTADKYCIKPVNESAGNQELPVAWSTIEANREDGQLILFKSTIPYFAGAVILYLTETFAEAVEFQEFDKENAGWEWIAEFRMYAAAMKKRQATNRMVEWTNTLLCNAHLALRDALAAGAVISGKGNPGRGALSALRKVEKLIEMAEYSAVISDDFDRELYLLRGLVASLSPTLSRLEGIHAVEVESYPDAAPTLMEYQEQIQAYYQTIQKIPVSGVYSASSVNIAGAGKNQPEPNLWTKGGGDAVLQRIASAADEEKKQAIAIEAAEAFAVRHPSDPSELSAFLNQRESYYKLTDPGVNFFMSEPLFYLKFGQIIRDLGDGVLRIDDTEFKLIVSKENGSSPLLGDFGRQIHCLEEVTF